MSEDYTTEQAISAYQHYNSVKAEDLIAEYISCTLRDDRNVTTPMIEAMKNRQQEIESAMAGVTYEHD